MLICLYLTKREIEYLLAFKIDAQHLEWHFYSLPCSYYLIYRWYPKIGRRRKCQPVKQITFVIRPIGSPHTDTSVSAGSQPHLVSFQPKILTLRMRRYHSFRLSADEKMSQNVTRTEGGKFKEHLFPWLCVLQMGRADERKYQTICMRGRKKMCWEHLYWRSRVLPFL